MTTRDFRWQALPVIALLVGITLLGVGFAYESIQQISGKFANVAALALVLALIGFAAGRTRHFGGAILISVFMLAAVVAFGWIPVAFVVVVGISFSTLGSLIYRPNNDGFSVLFILATIGAAIFVIALNILVRFPVNTPFVYGLLLFLPCLHFKALRATLKRIASLSSSTSLLSVNEIRLGSFLLFIVILHMAGAGLPERYADGALYHLYLGQTVARLHYWPGDFQSFVWALMPAGTDWLHAIGEVLAGQLATKGMSFLVFILLLGSLFHASLCTGVTRAKAILVTALAASTPLAFIETAALFIENGLTLFLFVAFWVLSEKELSVPRRILCGAILIGAALATKLHAVIFAGPLGLYALWIAWRSGKRVSAYAVIVSLGVLLLASFGYLYAYAKTGNPVFPFFNGIFKSSYYALENFSDSRWHQPPPWDLFYKITFHTNLYGEFKDGAFGFQALTLSAAILVATFLTNARQCMAVILGLFYIFVISFSTTYARYLYPGLMFLTFGAGALLMEGASEITLNRYWKSFVFTVVTLVTGLNLIFFNSAGWPLAQNFWGGFTSQEKWEAVADESLSQMALNRRASQDGLPSPRVLLLGDAVAANVAGTPLPVNWYNSKLVERFRQAKTVDDVRQILSDVKATHASLDVRNNLYELNMSLIGEALEQLGEPIFRKGALVLYRIHPDVWLGPDLAENSSAQNGFKGWDIRGEVSPIESLGLMLGTNSSMEKALSKSLLPDTLYRFSTTMNCEKAGATVHVAVLLTPKTGEVTRFDDFLPCNTKGTVERYFDLVAPSVPVTARLIIDHAEAKILTVTVREGYDVRGGRSAE